MHTLVFIFVFIFGTIIGSFLNVVICRRGTGRGLGGRSVCAVTGKTLQWYELIPIVSFVIQRGRSRYSKTRISWQYPLVEFFTGLSFLGIAWKLAPLQAWCDCGTIIGIFFFYAAIASLLVLVFVYDLRHRMIPDDFLYPLMTLSFAGLLFVPTLGGLSIMSFASGIIVALPILLIFLVTRGRGMGFGDVLLVVPFGWVLGLSSGFAAILLAFWCGALVGVGLLAARRARRTTELPFAPFLIIGFALAFLYNIDMRSIAEFFGRLI